MIASNLAGDNWISRHFGFLWAFRRFRKSSGVEVDISKLLPTFLKKKVTDPLEYGYKAAMFYNDRKGWGQEEYGTNRFYLDAPYGIVLSCSKDGGEAIPIAIISFKRKGLRTIRIEQIQGPSNCKEDRASDRVAALGKIKWERLLVRIICEWARLNGLKRVEVISCVRSHWYQKFMHQSMFMRYDVTARRMGFTEIRSKKIYRLKLKTAT